MTRSCLSITLSTNYLKCFLVRLNHSYVFVGVNMESSNNDYTDAHGHLSNVICFVKRGYTGIKKIKSSLIVQWNLSSGLQCNVSNVDYWKHCVTAIALFKCHDYTAIIWNYFNTVQKTCGFVIWTFWNAITNTTTEKTDSKVYEVAYQRLDEILT